MTAGSSPLSVKPPQSAGGFQPTTTNESLLILFTQNQAMQESLEKIEESIKEIKDELKSANDKYYELEKRVTVEERDKKILIGILVVIIPAILTIAVDLFFK